MMASECLPPSKMLHCFGKGDMISAKNGIYLVLKFLRLALNGAL